MTATFSPELERFRRDYARHRADEGRGRAMEELSQLPYLKHGRHARQWAVRACTFKSFVRNVVRPMRRQLGRPLDMVDLGAGNGWLSYRLASDGDRCTAIDIRDDAVDGLRAGTDLLRAAHVMPVVASFDALPLPGRSADLAVFNAALHYSLDLGATLSEAVRVVRPGGRIVILDSPFYATEAQGEAMVARKRRYARRSFGDRADSLLGLPFIEFLTADRLARASAPLGLQWRRRRVLYPLWYELRLPVALLKRERRPSRFDLWTADVP